MTKKIGTIFILSIVLACSYAVTSANAYAPNTQPITDSSYETALKEFFTHPEVPPPTPAVINPATGSLVTSAEVAEGVAEAAVAAGGVGIGATLAVGSVGLIAGGVVGYGAWLLGGAIYHLVDPTTPSTGGNVTSLLWAEFGIPAIPTFNTTGFAGLGGSTSQFPAGWVADIKAGPSGGPFTAFCTSTSASGCTQNTQTVAYAAAVVAAGNATQVFATSNTNACGTTAVNCYQIVRSAAQMGNVLQITPSTTTSGSTGTSFGAADGAATPSSVDVGAGIASLNPDGTGTAAQEAAKLALNAALDPTYGNPSSQTIPQPEVGETYPSYRQRLRDDGYLGNITILDDPNYVDDGTYWTTIYDTSVAPFPPGTCATACAPGTMVGVGEVTRVAVGSITSTSAIDVFDRTTGQWEPIPTTPPSYQPKKTTTISIYKVPGSYTPPTNPDPGGTPDAPPGGGGPTGGTCNTPSIPNLDLTPLTGLDFGSKFPFGVFTWLTTVYGYFNVSPVTPEVNIDFSSLSTFVPGFAAHYDVKLDYFDTYMGTIRTLISFALWVGAIWYIGVTLLGFRGGGDVSGAIEDGVQF